jgi:hypothetical protein
MIEPPAESPTPETWWLRRPSQVLVCTALLMAAGGCGGGSRSPATSVTRTRGAVPPLTSAQFARQLALLCPDSNHLVASQIALTQAISANDLAKASKIVASTEARAGSFFRKFERLTPPAQDRMSFVRHLSLTHQYLGIDARLAAALRAHVVAEVHRFGDFAQKVSDQRTTAAIALGLKGCGP